MAGQIMLDIKFLCTKNKIIIEKKNYLFIRKLID